MKQLISSLAGRKSLQVLVALFVALILLNSTLSVVLLVLNRNEANATKVQVISVTQKECSFFELIGNLPVTPPVTPTGISLVVDSRDAAFGLGCKGLRPPRSDLVNWANKFNITIDH